MSTVVITIKTDNAAFGEGVEDRQMEVARILNALSFKLETEDDVATNNPAVFDSNGNRVGRITYIEK